MSHDGWSETAPLQHLYLSRSAMWLQDVDCHQDPSRTFRCLQYLVSVENLTDPIHQPNYRWDSPEYQWLLVNLWKDQVLLSEVLQAPGSLSPRGRPPPCHCRHTLTTDKVEETNWTTKNHLADNSWWGCPANCGIHTACRKARDMDIRKPSRQYNHNFAIILEHLCFVCMR